MCVLLPHFDVGFPVARCNNPPNFKLKAFPPLLGLDRKNKLRFEFAIFVVKIKII